MRTALSWSAPGWVMLLATISLLVAIVLIMYAATRSPRPAVLRLCAYSCAATAAIATLNISE
ncbi:hypothetical protein [Streptosporangium sp. OZ121]|uniref:hypothetical protein n=1 Tax=Streptosporangium sp. OZ121 TaxID=3444183 RepID=UPI003F7A5A40